MSSDTLVSNRDATGLQLAKVLGAAQESYPIGNIYCIGRIYAKHAAELGNPVPTQPLVFMKSSGCLGPQAGEIDLTGLPEAPHHEVELVLWLQAGGRNLTLSQAGHAVGAYGVGLDLTLRARQEQLKNQGHPWTTAKNFQCSTLIGPLVRLTDGESRQFLCDAEIELRVNGQERQRSQTSQMLRSPLELVTYLSTLFPLLPGDCVFTGTPAGVAPVAAGDLLQARVGAAKSEWRVRM